MNKMISIIVPVYNVSEYLRKCLDSLINQTYQNLEIIVVDDGSTDNSGKICDQYMEQFPDRIRCIHTENHGLSAARNVGLDYSNGEYVTFVDSDDWVEPEMVEILLDNLIRSNADISSCGMKIDFDEEKSELYKTSDSCKCDQKGLFVNILDNSKVYGYVCNKLFIRRKLENIKFDETLMSCEDIDFTVRYAKNCNNGVYTLSELYHYRQRRESMTGDFGYNSRKLSVIQAYENIMPIYEKKCPECMRILLKNYLKININVLGRMKNSRYQNEKVEKMLLKNIHTVYNKVVTDKEISAFERINIKLSYEFPGAILKIKQNILKRKYKG